jgi:propanol-preferring alcohol dehydrogenase
MKAVLFPGEKEVRVVDDRLEPKPGIGEVLIKTKASAICRSDMHLYYGHAVVGGEEAGKGQVVPGHEPAGEIVALGGDTSGVEVGDRVGVYLAIGCGHCENCLSGYRMLCPEVKILGFDLDGGNADYMVVPAVNCVKLPDEMSYEVGAVMTDMIGTQYHTQKRLGVSGTDTVAVFGLGPMGSAAVLIGKARGARVIAVDVLDTRLENARELGADETINSLSEDSVGRLRDLTRGRGVDVAIDCSGAPLAQNASLDATRAMGSVAFVGESPETTINPSDQMIRKVLTVIGGWYFPLGEFDEIARFVVDNEVPVEKMISHRFSLDDAPEAFRMFDNQETEKAVFVWS